MRRVYEVLLKRAGVFATVLALVLVLAACGNNTNTGSTGNGNTSTATVAATSASGGTTATDTTTTSGGTTATDTTTTGNMTTGTATSGASIDNTPTEAMAAASPSAAESGGSAPQAGATPVSDWKPGAHANTIAPPAKLAAPGFLTLGTDATYPPQEYIGADGKAVGFDIDIGEEIASRMGLTTKWVNFKFNDIIPALRAGQFDAVISAMTITDERKKAVDFVEYFSAGQAVLVKKGNPLGIKTLEDLSGHTAVAEQGTVEEQTLKDLNQKLQAAGKSPVNVLIYPDDTSAVDQLRIGRADATLHDSPVAAYYSQINPNFEVAIPNFEAAPEGIATAPENKAMHDAIQKAIDAMNSDGTMKAILAKWGIK